MQRFRYANMIDWCLTTSKFHYIMALFCYHL